jgi:hypothetical protein
MNSLNNIFYYIDLFSAFGITDYSAFEKAFSYFRRTEERNHYKTILRDSFPRGLPCSHPCTTKEYLLREHPNRNGYNRQTKISQRGLQTRINREAIETKRIEREQKIKFAFSREIPNRTHQKRHRHSFQSWKYR